VRVSCRDLCPPEAGFAGAPVAPCTFELDAGVTFTYRGSWAAAGHESPWFGRWRIDGTAAAARWEGPPVPRSSSVEAADNIRSLAMVEAAIAAARSGGWVDVERP